MEQLRFVPMQQNRQDRLQPDISLPTPVDPFADPGMFRQARPGVDRPGRAEKEPMDLPSVEKSFQEALDISSDACFSARQRPGIVSDLHGRIPPAPV
jgi:hypothetical protein